MSEEASDSLHESISSIDDEELGELEKPEDAEDVYEIDSDDNEKTSYSEVVEHEQSKYVDAVEEQESRYEDAIEHDQSIEVNAVKHDGNVEEEEDTLDHDESADEDAVEHNESIEGATEHNESIEEGGLEEGEHESDEEICDKTESLYVKDKKYNNIGYSREEEDGNLDNSFDNTIENDENRDELNHQNGKNNDEDKYSMYDVSDAQTNDLNSSFMSSDANKENERERKSTKRKSDEGLEMRDELDFEEEKESGEEGEDSDGENECEKRVVINKEEGELSDEDEDDASLRQEPKTVCRFFNKGQCTWGTNCRFLHPGVSDKGNYNMFAAPKPQSQTEKEETATDKERPREVRRYIPETTGFESAWERGLRHAKEMMKRANKRKETDADFEEKRFNLSLGQAELDRENDYYTRPASPVYKPSDEIIEGLDPYEKQAIRHFRGGHFENFEVRYKVDQAYPNRGPEHIRSRRDKFEREVTERVPRRMRAGASPAVEEPNKAVKEKRYPRPRSWKEDRAQEVPATGLGKGEAEVWADPWARRKTPVKKTKKVTRNRSYSSGSSSRSSRSSRSSSYSSYSRSGSRSTSRSRSSRSSSRSITPPIHPRQQRATMNRGGGRGGRGRGMDRGRGGGGPPRNFYQTPQFSQPPNPPPNHPLAPDVNFLRQTAPGAGVGNRRGRGREDNRFVNSRPQDNRNVHEGQRERFANSRPQDTKNIQTGPKERAPAMQFKQEPRFSVEPRERVGMQRKVEQRNPQTDQHERRPPFPPIPDARQKPTDSRERVDMFGRTIRKEIPKSPSKSPKRVQARPHGRRRFSLSPSRSRSGSKSGSSSGSSASRSRSRSHSGSRSGSRSSSASSVVAPINPVSKRKEKVRRAAPPPPGTVSYGETTKTKAMDLVKVAGQKQQIKLTLKKPGPVKPVDKTVLDVDDDSGESDTDARILKKRKVDSAPMSAAPPPKRPRVPSPTALASLTTGTVGIKKPSAARREELLKQLRAVEDAIARKRSKPL